MLGATVRCSGDCSARIVRREFMESRFVSLLIVVSADSLSMSVPSGCRLIKRTPSLFTLHRDLVP